MEAAVLGPATVQPDRATVAVQAATYPLVAMWRALPLGDLEPVSAFQALAGDGPGLILEELDLGGRAEGYSVVGGDPAALVLADLEGVRLEGWRRPLPLQRGWAVVGPGGVRTVLNRLLEQLRAPAVPGLPTMTGGLAGLLCYEAAALLDGYDHPRGGPPLPAAPISLMVLDRVAVFDHRRQQLLLVVHQPASAPYDQGVAALAEMTERLRGAPQRLAPLPPLGGGGGVAANLSPERYRAGVGRFQEYIAAGEIYQGVLSRRLSVAAREPGLWTYRRLRGCNPSPAMSFLRLPGLELAGSSPEPLLKVSGGTASTRPIAGTRRRGRSEAEDLALERELLGDAKELAEHAMLVDLARNDLGRVCLPGTVVPTQFLRVQRFPRVMHMVSEVAGELAPGNTAFDALSALFPAGTVTGAPKRRAMALIAQEEPTARGPYAGACGYLSFAGYLEFCITIRTAVITGGQVHVQAGAGVVSDSDPELELAETRAKGSAILAAVTPASEGGV